MIQTKSDLERRAHPSQELSSKFNNFESLLVSQQAKAPGRYCAGKANRKGKTFCCSKCGNKLDADLNAASNHEIELYDINYHKVWFDRLNRSTGFFWFNNGVFNQNGESIVSHAQKE